MASEDSADDLVFCASPLLAFEVHLVGELDDLDETASVTMRAALHQADDSHEDQEIARPGRVPHVLEEKRHDLLAQERSGSDPEHEDVGIPRLGANCAATKDLLHQLEELLALPVLIYEQFRLHEIAEGGGRMSLIDTVTLPSPSTKPATNQRLASSSGSLSC